MCRYDAEAVSLLKQFLEPHSAAMRSSKLLHAFTALARHCALTLHAPTLTAMLEDLSGITGLAMNDEWASQPGWFARCLDNLTEKLSNGAKGILPEMRASVARNLHKMYSAYAKADWSGKDSASQEAGQPASPPQSPNSEPLKQRIGNTPSFCRSLVVDMPLSHSHCLAGMVPRGTVE